MKAGAELLVAVGAGGALADMPFGCAAVKGGDLVHGLLEPIQQPGPLLFVECAHSAHDFTVVGDDIISGACVDSADIDDRGLLRVQLITGDILENADQLDTGINRADAFLRRGAVAPFAVKPDAKTVAGRHTDAAADGKLAGFQRVRRDMDGNRAIRLGVFQASGGDHIPSAGEALFVRLEHQNGLTGQLALMVLQNFGRAQQHSGVGVMAAGVHGAGAFRGEGQTGQLVHGQGVHIRPQQDAFAAFWADISHKGVGNNLPIFHAPFLQLAPHQGGGLRQRLAHLRMAMDLSAPLDD